MDLKLSKNPAYRYLPSSNPLLFQLEIYSLTCEYYLPRNKNQQDNSGFDHSVNQPWKQLWLVARTHKSQKLT